VRLLYAMSLLQAGELRLTQGAAAEALTDAERALAIDPFLESAHRLAIAANMQRRDPDRTVAAVARVERALDELGADPEPATLMLVRQAARRWRPAPQVARAS
jgi:LuxR family transcriptional regulator, maltose regulon positive regulatory protein